MPGHGSVGGVWRAHESVHRYSLEEFGLTSDTIRTRLADLFERFGWDDDAGRPR